MSKPTVAIWKNVWLPRSETFVVSQIESLKSWDSTTIGFHNISNGLLQADFAPYPNTKLGRAQRRFLQVKGKQGAYINHLRGTESALIHAHFGSGGIYTLPLAQRQNVPHITTFHGADTHLFGHFMPGSELWYRNGLKKLFDRGDRFLAASQYLADRLILSGAPAGKVEVLYTGTKIVPQISSNTRRGIAFVGRLIGIKGVKDLLLAVALMKNSTARSTPITIAGDGPLHEELRSLAYNLDLDCTFVGHLPSHEVAGFMARHQVFCAPSMASPKGTREGFGMVFLEAALQGLPVVAYASGGVTEAVVHGSTGLLAEEGNIGQLSKYLERLLLDQGEAEEMGQNGRQRVMTEFSLEKQTKLLESIYLDLVV